MVLLEKHLKEWLNIMAPRCECSYCKSVRRQFLTRALKIAIWIPKVKKWNSWFVIILVGKKYFHYLRFTLPFLKK